MSATGENKFALETLALMPTWHCDVACHHCVFESSPRLTRTLGLDLALEAIAQAAGSTAARRVTLSGGEPFLRADYLLAIAKAAASSGLAFRVVSNGTFGRDARAANELLTELLSIGVESISISWDAFHEQFIEPSAVAAAIKACRALGISVRLTAVVTRTHDLGAALSALGDEGFELPATQVKCLPVGRARKKVKAHDLIPAAEHERGRACGSDFDTLALTPDGRVYPCCAVGGFTEGIALGKFPESSLAQLLTRRDRELKWVALAAQGPRFFSDRMTEPERAALQLDEGLHDCVQCNRIFGCQAGRDAAERILDDVRKAANDMLVRAAANAG